MKDLLYFTFSKLLVRVEYSKETNTIKYSSHREIALNERIVIEQYILTNFAAKTEYYQHQPSMFIYLGEDVKLKRELNMLRLKKTLKLLAVREKDVKEKVDELMSCSMSNYYFEQIGDTLLEMRKHIKSAKKDSEDLIIIKKAKSDIQELVEAYNIYSDRKISLEKAVPADLKEYFEYN